MGRPAMDAPSVVSKKLRLNSNNLGHWLGLLAAKPLNLHGLVRFLGVELFLHHQLLIKLAHHHSLFMSCLRTFHLRLVRPGQVDRIQDHSMARIRKFNLFAASEDFMTSM